MAIYVYDSQGKAHAWAGTPEQAKAKYGWTTEKPQVTTPTGLSSIAQATTPTTSGYQSPYFTDITNALASISKLGSFSYDPSNDEGLQSAQDEAISGVSRGASRRNMLYSDSNKSQMGKAALALVPQFEQNAFSKYQSQLGNLFNQLSTLTGLENQNYSKYRDTVNDQNTAQQNERTNYENTVGRFNQDYQAEINKIQNDGDPSNDWQISILAAARQQKIADLQKIDAATKAAQQKAADDKAQQEFENNLKLKQTNYNIGKPYYSPNTGSSEKALTPLQQQTNVNNAKISQMTNWIYNVPTSQEALQRLAQNKALILQQLQEAGYSGSDALKYYQDMYADLSEN